MVARIKKEVGVDNKLPDLPPDVLRKVSEHLVDDDESVLNDLQEEIEYLAHSIPGHEDRYNRVRNDSYYPEEQVVADLNILRYAQDKLRKEYGKLEEYKNVTPDALETIKDLFSRS